MWAAPKKFSANFGKKAKTRGRAILILNCKAESLTELRNPTAFGGAWGCEATNVIDFPAPSNHRARDTLHSTQLITSDVSSGMDLRFYHVHHQTALVYGSQDHHCEATLNARAESCISHMHGSLTSLHACHFTTTPCLSNNLGERSPIRRPGP